MATVEFVHQTTLAPNSLKETPFSTALLWPDKSQRLCIQRVELNLEMLIGWLVSLCLFCSLLRRWRLRSSFGGRCRGGRRNLLIWRWGGIGILEVTILMLLVSAFWKEEQICWSDVVLFISLSCFCLGCKSNLWNNFYIFIILVLYMMINIILWSRILRVSLLTILIQAKIYDWRVILI